MMNSIIFKIIFHLGIHHLIRVKYSSEITILCLHRISFEKDDFFPPIHPDKFVELLKYLQKYYEIINFNSLKFTKKQDKPLLILSFDDGYYDFYEIALPILMKFNITANHNIVNRCASYNEIIWTQKLNLLFNELKIKNSSSSLLEFDIDNLTIVKHNWEINYMKIFNHLLTVKHEVRNEKLDRLIHTNEVDTSTVKMMNWDQIIECNKYGIEFGSHTYSHDVLSTLDKTYELEKEIELSINEINSKVKIKCNILSIPNGQFNEYTKNYLETNKNIEYILEVNDDKKCNNTYYDRVYLINEENYKMILRTELVPQKLRKLWTNIKSKK